MTDRFIDLVVGLIFWIRLRSLSAEDRAHLVATTRARRLRDRQ